MLKMIKSLEFGFNFLIIGRFILVIRIYEKEWGKGIYYVECYKLIVYFYFKMII